MSTHRKDTMIRTTTRPMLSTAIGLLLSIAILLLPGCSTPDGRTSDSVGDPSRSQFLLKETPAEQMGDILSRLNIGTVTIIQESNAVAVAGDPNELQKASIIVRLADCNEPYAVTSVVPVSAARTLPSNSEIARFLGNVPVGTFAAPPEGGRTHGAIIDIHRDQVIAVCPEALQNRLMTAIRLGPNGLAQRIDNPAAGGIRGNSGQSKDGSETTALSGQEETPLRPRVRLVQPADPSSRAATLPAETEETIQPAPSRSAENALPDQEQTDSPSGAAKSSDPNLRDTVSIPNADEILKLDLPAQLEMPQFLELIGEYLHLDYLYEPEKIKGTVLLRLHGKLQGQMQVRDLYGLLESVLRFKGFVMTRHENNLVTIVPAAEVLQANPDLIDPNNRDIQAGDIVVTSIFELRHIAAPAASTLLDSMKLSLAVTPVEDSRSLIVTCYAHQIDRIERLLSVVDRPGQPRDFTFRQLRYTTANSLTKKVQTLLKQMKGVGVGAGPAQTTVKAADRPSETDSSLDTVYLDADDRTNRILIIGYAEQIALANRLIDSLDIAQKDLRVLKVYDLQYVEAEEIKTKLQELEIIGARGGTTMVGAAKIEGVQTTEAVVVEDAVVVPIEATNSLAINATEEQHARIEAMLAFLDAQVRTESIPYEIYFLENQDPAALAEVLEKIIHETVQDKDGKIQKVLQDTNSQILIVPDKNTFSLIVYAAKEDQEWISKLIKTLDRRRPQVLIDVTLVEIRKTDEFDYDLNLITSIPDLTETGGQTKQFYVDENTTVTDKLLQSDRSQFADFEVASGVGTGFYADRHIDALLTAVQTKNYGRVLAKPKVLVNDNEKGNIKTAETTYVKTTSSSLTSESSNLVETSTKYEPYDAGIKLEITPHISEGQLLRLEITLGRSDFTSTAGDKPPDKTSSDITTIVTVPDSSTIILGGMLRLSQSKVASKVPILGDLPFVGGLFRSIDDSDSQSKLYIFVRAEIIRPTDIDAEGYDDLKRISDENRRAFEKHEQEFQNYQSWPGIKSRPVDPPRVLEAR
ncbi:MAG: secretin N-terminal domain-containing protein [Solirubrobacterales bacterium]